MKLRVGLVQLENSPDIGRNLAAMLSAIDRLTRQDAHLIVFPECALTGFSAAAPSSRSAEFQEALNTLGARSSESGVALLVPSIIRDTEQTFDGGYCFQDGQRTPFFKAGLTPSEAGFFTPRTDGLRVIDCCGFRLGILICVEAEHAHDAYVDGVDAYLWPTYWGWKPQDEWTPEPADTGQASIYRNVGVWKRPLLQANFSRNCQADGRKTGPEGLSVVVDADNRCIARGAHQEAGELLVTLCRDEMGTSIRSVSGDMYV